jgi:hypothetical protein
MTGPELIEARRRLKLKAVDFARAFDVNDRTVRGWEFGERNGKPNLVPRPIAVLVKAALKYAWVRDELGIANVKVRAKQRQVGAPEA